MTTWRVPFSVPEIGAPAKTALIAALESGWPSQGPRTRAFEEAFARSVGTAHAVATSSGTAALHLALAACRLAPGDEVVVPSLTFVATANAVVAAGGRPVFADVTSLDDPCLSAATVERVLGPKTRAIIAVHYGGMPCEMGPLRQLAAARGLALIEDAAHATGAFLDGRAVGSLGDAGCFSFYATKNLSTIEGGMVTTDDDALAESVRRGRSHGLTGLSWERHLGASPDRDVVQPGFNYRMDDLRAALGLAGLGALPEVNARRAALVQRYRMTVASSDCLALAFSDVRPGRVTASHLAALVVRGGREERDALSRKLEAAGVQTSHHYAPAHGMTCYRRDGVELPMTDLFADSQLSLPLFSVMSPDQIDLICELLR
jgi:dTDP-4-amino-4,6-dideoxygalactose transaminase